MTKDLLAEGCVQRANGLQINPMAWEKVRELDLDCAQPDEAGYVARLKFDQQIDVAVKPEVVASAEPKTDSRRI